MKIRTQLLLACFLLAVLPLTGVVFYSYRSSRRALEDAYHREASRLTAQMDRRLSAIGSELDQRMAGLSAIPMAVDTGTDAQAKVVDNILMAMGETAPLVDALEFMPATPAPSAPPAPGIQPPAVPQIASGGHAPPAPPIVDVGPIVIDLPEINVPRFTMPPDFGNRVAEITRLTTQLGREDLAPEQRKSIEQTLKDKQEQLNNEMESRREVFHGQVAQSNERRERQRMLQERVEERKRIARQIKEQTRVYRMDALTPEQLRALKTKENQAGLLFGQKFKVSVHNAGKVVGQIRAQLATDEVIKRVLGGPANEDSTEIPFAVDREGNVYTRSNADLVKLEELGLVQALKSRKPVPQVKNWIIATSFHKDSGLQIGVARPVGENLEELRDTAARNFGYGVGVIALALIGILPVARHFTEDVRIVTTGAERIAHGDLTTRLPVRSKNEFGQLALAFNRMAEDLSHQQEKIVQQERARREQEIQQRVLEVEYERKSEDLEEARRFQLSMLPKHVPQHDRYDVAVLTQTAAEVGGDYYDFHVSPDGVLSVTIGDATGHGAKAGTMVTVVKTLFARYDSAREPAAFLSEAAETIKRMDLGRMAMALSLARFDRNRLTIATAGMPPMLVHRAGDGRIDEITLGATPLGTLGVDYEQTQVNIDAGDTVLLMSDGFPELLSADGRQLGYVLATQEFAAAAAAPAAGDVIAHLAAAAKRWHGDQPPNDDITFVVVRCRA
ncbi:MAG TPA: SpoIIE family protein phosphatase [Thermoanaerobaculia bacterium]